MAQQNYPSRLVILSEMSVKDKEKYYKLITATKAKCSIVQMDDGSIRYVANLRMLEKGVKSDSSHYSQDYLAKYNNGDIASSINFHGNEIVTDLTFVDCEPFNVQLYPKLISFVCSNGDTVKSKTKIISWLMKNIDDLYDSRFNYEKNNRLKEANGESFAGAYSDEVLNNFPAYIYQRTLTTQGLRHIVTSSVMEIIYNTEVYRSTYLEVETFAKFLAEQFDNDDLLFFLYVRSVIAKLLNISFRTRWGKSESGAGSRGSKGLWMTFRECVHVAQVVFGDSDMARDVILLIAPHVVGQKTDTTDTRRIDIALFLSVIVSSYHDIPHDRAKNSPLSAAEKSGASASKSRDPLSLSAQQAQADSSLSSYLTSLSTDRLITNSQSTPQSSVVMTNNSSSSMAVESYHRDACAVLGFDHDSSHSFTEDDINEYKYVKGSRESEFVEYLTESLAEHPSYEEIAAELLQHVSQRVNALLSDYTPSDIGDFDYRLISILQSEDFTHEMEFRKDDIVSHLQG